MDTFNPNSSAKNAAIIRDILTKNSNQTNIVSNEYHKYANQVKDNISLSQDEFVRVLERVKSENITDFFAIKDIIAFKDINSFDYNALSDNQIENLLAAIRSNISNTLSDFIYNKKLSSKNLEITALEKSHLDTVLGRIRDSQITNLIQGIDFIKRSSNDRPGLFRKISQNLVSIIIEKEREQIAAAMNSDSFSGAIITSSNNFTNPFGNFDNIDFNHPSNPDEAVAYLDSMIKDDKKRKLDQYINPEALSRTTKILTSYYLNKDNPAINDEMIKNALNRVTSEDQLWFQNNILHKNVSFLNTIAARVAADKAKTIITARLIGEVSGSSLAALSTAYLTGTSPMLGVVGSFVLTMISAIVGMLVGKMTGEEIGKLVTGINLENNIDFENENNLYEYPRNNNDSDDNTDKSTEDDEESTETEEEIEKPVDLSPFGYINKDTIEAIKNRNLLFKTK